MALCQKYLCNEFDKELSPRRRVKRFSCDMAATEWFILIMSQCCRHIADLLLLGRDVAATQEIVTTRSRCCRHIRVCYYWVAMWSPHVGAHDCMICDRTRMIYYYCAAMLSPHTVLLLAGRDVVVTEGFVASGSRCRRHTRICYYWVAMRPRHKDLLILGCDVVATDGFVGAKDSASWRPI